jgi:hypothetical protein
MPSASPFSIFVVAVWRTKEAKSIRVKWAVVKQAQNVFMSALTEALGFDLDKALDTPSSSSPEERHEAFVKIFKKHI